MVVRQVHERRSGQQRSLADCFDRGLALRLRGPGEWDPNGMSGTPAHARRRAGDVILHGLLSAGLILCLDCGRDAPVLPLGDQRHGVD